jgi:hypothetical protein
MRSLLASIMGRALWAVGLPHAHHHHVPHRHMLDIGNASRQVSVSLICTALSSDTYKSHPSAPAAGSTAAPLMQAFKLALNQLWTRCSQAASSSLLLSFMPLQAFTVS